MANEVPGALQATTRRVLDGLRHAGTIDDYRVLSPGLVRAGSPEAGEAAVDDEVASASTWRRDVTLMYHPSAWRLSAPALTRLLRSEGGVWVYYEGDPYGLVRHGLPWVAQRVGRRASIVFTVGTGAFRRNFTRAGARDVRWVPSAFDYVHVGPEPSPPVSRTVDFVMIANRHMPRTPLRLLPGARQRAQFVELMTSEFGDTFQVWGRGWTGPSAQGSLDYSRQASAVQSAWFSVNWDHFPQEPRYFSNRLPIALATGSFHLTTAHPGYAALFEGVAGIDFADTPRGLVETARRLRTRLSDAEISEAIESGKRWAYDHLRAERPIAQFLRAGGIDVSDDEAIAASEEAHGRWLREGSIGV
ncbi:glycosyltransferase family protein [Demequina pelophila]|uniref:glycosyltransferase family protein n=1 Tax=Demequina pelophila TaxID=1638984 RepID=UPI0007816C4D|nr:hypothetical protein [Demequina pelophila]